MEKRNHYTAEFKAKVVLELLGEESTLNQVAAKYQFNPQMLSKWKSDFVKNAAMVFEKNICSLIMGCEIELTIVAITLFLLRNSSIYFSPRYFYSF